VRDNVICGGDEKVIYAADWTLLNTGELPFSLDDNEIITDWLDVADLINEHEHDYRFPSPDAGYVELRILTEPTQGRDVLDGGRRIPENGTESFRLTSQRLASSMRLIVRTAPAFPGKVEVSMDGHFIGELTLEPSDTWVELSLPLPSPLKPNQTATFTMTARSTSRWVNYHVWLVASP